MFTKLFSSIIHSTVWLEPLETKVVWITMLAIADRDGIVEASAPGLAKSAGVTVAATREALKTFLNPDPDSRTKEHDGRRIEECDGGWRLLNYDAYRRKASLDERREKNAARMRRVRAENQAKTGVCAPVQKRSQSAYKAEANAEAEADSEIEIGAELDQRRANGLMVPEGWEPKDLHRKLAAERGLDFDGQVIAFQCQEFQRSVLDWDLRFKQWLAQAHPPRRQASANAPPSRGRGRKMQAGDR